MGKNAHLKHLFEGRRRQCTLTDWRPLKDKSKVKRVKMIITQSLSSQSFEGMPEEFDEEVSVMLKQKSTANFKKIAVEMEGVLFSVFATDTSSLWWKSHAVQLNGFKLLGEGVDEKRTVDLQFTAYVPLLDDMRKWLDDTLHEDFFLEAIPSQRELSEDAPAKKSKKRNKQIEFDPAALQKAAKDGEYHEPVN